MQSFALADSGQSLVFLQTNGALTEAAPGFGTSPISLATTGVQSFVVGNGGQDVYWLTFCGSFNKSINGGPGVYSSTYPLAPNSLNINAVQSFALADQGLAIVFLQTNGALTETIPGLGNSTTSFATTGVQAFAVGNGGQDVYCLTAGGSLDQSIDGGSGIYGGNSLNANFVESFAVVDDGQVLVFLQTTGALTEAVPGAWYTTLASNAAYFQIGSYGQVTWGTLPISTTSPNGRAT